jgi:serine/threonine-protein kinase
MRSTIFAITVILICSWIAGCKGPAEQAVVEPTETAIQLGFPGNPVTSNTDWKPVIEEFDDVQMALVPVGCFIMGDDSGRENEIPAHEQCINEPFYIDVYEVSNRQYGKDVKGTITDWPIVYIDWYEASTYCESRGGRLPTEVEWEYAARGPDNLLYTWRSERLSTIYLVSHGGSAGTPLPVGSRPDGASWVGAQDLIGNVWEWTSSIKNDYPYTQSASIEGIDLLDEDESVVMRGNNFSEREDEEFRASYRRTALPTRSSEGIGFRCIRLK